jgi:hypothetical protein
MTTPDPTELAQQRAALLEAARTVDAPTRSGMRLRNLLLMISALVVPFAVWIAAGGIRVAPRPLWFVVGTALGWAVAGVWGLWASLSRQGSMLGPSRRWLHAIVILVPVLMFVWMLGWDLVDTDRLAAWPGRVGWLCLKLTLAAGIWPMIALILMRRGTDPVHPGATGAAIGASVGCTTGVLLDLWCPIADPAHVLLGHVLPLLLLSFGGVLLGKWLLSLRGRRNP